MRCHKCGAASRVTYTTEQPDLFRTKRRRICDNNHRFTSYEVHESIVLAVSRVKLASRIEGFKQRVRLYARDLRIWQARVLHGQSYASLGRLHDLAESGVRRIVASMSKQRSGQKLGAHKEKDEP